jgi:hypothetical protein
LFNGRVTVMISTDRKFHLRPARLFQNNVSIGGKLYRSVPGHERQRDGAVLANVPAQVSC